MADTVKVWQQIGEQLRESAVETVFGLMGDGNLRFIPHMTDACGLRYVAARHESGAIAMADAYARVTGTVGVCTVTQGPGLTNALTALTEAAKAHSPLVLLLGDTPADDQAHNQNLDHAAVTGSVGVEHCRLASPRLVAGEIARALERAAREQRPVALSIPIDVQDEDTPFNVTHRPLGGLVRAPDPSVVSAVATALERAERPLILAGRGAVNADARGPLVDLADRLGALVVTTSMAKGLFSGYPYSLGLCGGFATDRGAELIGQADVVVVFGSSLNPWTTRRGQIFAESARLIRCDIREPTPGGLTAAHETVLGDASLVARALTDELAHRGFSGRGYRRDGLERGVVKLLPDRFDDESLPDRVDPRALMIAMDRMLPQERTVIVDSGYYVIFPTTLLSVPDARGFVFSQAFQSLGLGIGGAVGAAVARPDRLTVLVIGDGGLVMTLGELETAARYRLPLLVIVMNDGAYGAEIHTMEELDLPTDHAFLQDVDAAAVARGLGFGASTVRTLADCESLREWAVEPHGPYLVDCKINWRVLGNWGD